MPRSLRLICADAEAESGLPHHAREQACDLAFAGPSACVLGFSTHAINQVWISVMAKGPSNVALNSGFRNRDSPAYKSELGQAIFNFASAVPDGMLVFFASYATLDACIEHWKSDAVW